MIAGRFGSWADTASRAGYWLVGSAWGLLWEQSFGSKKRRVKHDLDWNQWVIHARAKSAAESCCRSWIVPYFSVNTAYTPVVLHDHPSDQSCAVSLTSQVSNCSKSTRTPMPAKPWSEAIAKTMCKNATAPRTSSCSFKTAGINGIMGKSPSACPILTSAHNHQLFCVCIDELDSDAETIVLVMDNCEHTRIAAELYEAVEPAEARRLIDNTSSFVLHTFQASHPAYHGGDVTQRFDTMECLDRAAILSDRHTFELVLDAWQGESKRRRGIR